jgi:chromosomal replication initiation ATPase DnaA
MLDAWLKRTRDWLARAEKLLALPEQEFALWGLTRALSGTSAPVVCLCGEPGSGKSSLIRQVIRQSAECRKRTLIVADAVAWAQWLLDCESTGSNAVGPTQGGVAACENLQQLRDPRKDGDRLAAWIDRTRAAGVAIILTADRLPSQIADLSPRLVNRLHGGLLAGIRPLSEASQKRLLQHWSLQEAIEKPPMGISRDVTTVGQWKDHVFQLVRRPAASAVPAVPIGGDESLAVIAEVVAADFQVSPVDLCAGSRTQHLRIPRSVAMVLAREFTSCSLMTISRYFGCRSHSSVVRGCSRLNDHLPDAPSLRQQLQLLKTKVRRELSAHCG